MYELGVPHVPDVCQHNNLEISFTPYVICDTGSWTPSAEVLGQHGLALQARDYGFAGGTFYYTTECQSLRDMVQFSHETWDHPPKDHIRKIVD